MVGIGEGSYIYLRGHGENRGWNLMGNKYMYIFTHNNIKECPPPQSLLLMISAKQCLVREINFVSHWWRQKKYLGTSGKVMWCMRSLESIFVAEFKGVSEGCLQSINSTLIKEAICPSKRGDVFIFSTRCNTQKTLQRIYWIYSWYEGKGNPRLEINSIQLLLIFQA
jgi:hypothetical protein